MDSSLDSNIPEKRDDSSQAINEARRLKNQLPNGSIKDSDSDPPSSGSLASDSSPHSPRELDPQISNRRGKKRDSTKYYSDQYVEVFNQTVQEFESGEDGVPPLDFEVSQIGAVTWLPAEKERLFHALSRRGRLDVPAVAKAVGKSVLEVQDYLNLLREREAEKHLYEKQTKQISHADIPAAIEVSQECEFSLERAADALASLQNQHDAAFAERRHNNIWLIDKEMARTIDEKLSDDAAAQEAEESVKSFEFLGDNLFRLTIWLELSERIFMNPGAPNLDRNWRNVAAEGDHPAITYTAFSDFHSIAVEMTRRIMQSAIFLAQSRIRSTTHRGFAAQPLVKEGDVLAAIEILDMLPAVSDWLVGVARRNSLNIIRGTHNRGDGRRATLTYDEVEEIISARRGGRRRRRSVSSASTSSWPSSTASSEGDEQSPNDRIEDVDTNVQPSREISLSAVSLGGLASEALSLESGSDGEDLEGNEYSESDSNPCTSTQRKGRLRLELQQDAYLDNLDRLVSRGEESRLWQALGSQPHAIKEKEKDKLGARPKVPRKTVDDLTDWQGPYCAEWEAFGEMLPKRSFAQNATSGRKRSPHGDQEGEPPRKSRVMPTRRHRFTQDIKLGSTEDSDT